jgi:hypothetical protein
VTSQSGSSGSGAEMALLVPNWNPSNEHTGPFTNAQLAFPSAKRELPQHTTKGRDLAPNRKGRLSKTRTSRVKHPVPLSSEPPGSRNAKMSRCLFLRDFTFREIRTQGVSLFLGVSGHRKAEMSQRLILRVFVNRDFGFHDFGKSGYKGYLCPLEPPVAEIMKCRKG